MVFLWGLIIVAVILSDSVIERNANEEIMRLVGDRKAFMANTRMSYEAVCPEFIRCLKEKDLNENEIERCCLYVLGLRGKDIGNYIKSKRNYNYSSDIRKKLGLGEHDTNLGNYLKGLLFK